MFAYLQRLICCFGLFIATPVFALEESAHKMVVALAQLHFTEATRAAMAELYGDNWPRYLTNYANWAEWRNDSQAIRTVFFSPEDTSFDPAKHCASGCVVGALKESLEVLKNDEFSDEQHRQALQFFMHLITDLHIPINAGMQEDQGGWQVELETSDLKKITLGDIWHQHFYQRLPGTWFDQAHRLNRSIETTDIANWTTSVDPIDWAWETHQLAIQSVYPLNETGRYNAAYIQQMYPLFKTQLSKAAIRLAVTLNQVFQTAESS